jgi:hypothetical protein
MILALVMAASLAFAQQGDGAFWAARLAGGQVQFFRSDRPTPGAAQAVFAGTPVRYLTMINGAVQELGADGKAAVDAAIATHAEAARQAAAAEEAARVASETAEEARLAALPYQVSKYKIVEALDSAGQLDTFIAFLSADTKQKFKWDAAVVLDSDNAMVTNALNQLAPLLGEGFVSSNFLRSCRSDML